MPFGNLSFGFCPIAMCIVLLYTVDLMIFFALFHSFFILVYK